MGLKTNLPRGLRTAYAPVYGEAMNETTPRYTVTEAAALVGVSADTLRRMEEKGNLSPVRIGGRKDRLYSDQDIEQAKSHRNAA